MRAGRLLTALGLASVALSLLVRVVHRGPYYPGLDLAGSANGLFIVSTRPSLADAVAYIWHQNRHYGAPFPYFSALATLLPGCLTAVWPWEYWAHVLTFASALLTFIVIAKVTGLRPRDSWVVLLAWGASPALLSFSVAGLPWANTFLPHALALWVTAAPRLRRRVLVSLVLCLLIDELSWHVYELGRTVFVVFIAAALLRRDVPLRTRAVWIFAAAIQLWQVFAHPTQHTTAYATANVLRPDAIVEGLGVVWRLFVAQRFDLPVLAAAAVLACLIPTRARLLLLLLAAVQLALVAGVAIVLPNGGAVWARRFLMVDFYGVVLVASLYGEGWSGSRVRQGLCIVIASVLLAGNAWQLIDLRRFVAQGFAPAPVGYWTLPFTTSFDYYVQPANVDWSRELRARVDAGETLLLLYNFGAYDENYTNPEASLERLYVSIGHQRFVDSVFVFGSAACRHNCLPIRPLEEVGPFLDGLREGRPVDPRAITGYYVADNPVYPEALPAEKRQIIAEIQKRFTLRPQPPEGTKFTRFTLE